MKSKIIVSFIILAIGMSLGCVKKTQIIADQPNTMTSNPDDFSNRKPFMFTVDTDIIPDYVLSDLNELYDGNVVIELFIYGHGYPVKYDLDCESDGDYEYKGLTEGAVENKHDGCIYKPNSGKHQISLRGDIHSIYLCSGEPHGSVMSHVIISVDSWGDIEWKDMSWFASTCEVLKTLPKEAPDLRQVKSMTGMFGGRWFGARVFNQPIDHWDVSNVEEMGSMFAGASSFNQPLENWDVSNVKDMGSMFAGASSFNQPLNQWNVVNVEDMSQMFYGARSFNQPWDQWNVSKVKNMEYMFREAKSFNQPINSWDVSKVESMLGMFVEAEVFNQPLDKWNVSNVKNMMGMFYKAMNFNNQSTEQWDMTNVENKKYMFDKVEPEEHEDDYFWNGDQG